MGEVWQAFDEKLGRRVALKLMLELLETDEILKKRFVLEGRAIAALQSPYAVQVYDSGLTDNGLPYTVMELLDGEDFEARLRRCGRICLEAMVPIVTQVSRALENAHGADIIHRDLKPANIFLTQSSSDISVKVLDFGVAAVRSRYVAKYIDHRLTQVNEIIGTPHYMSPEQICTPSEVDHRTDLWSLGVIAFEALTGQLPFQGKKNDDMFVNICTKLHPKASSLAPWLDSDIDAFFDRALHKEPDKRFACAKEMATEFAALAARQEVKRPTKVLVVDDETDVQLLIEQYFREHIRSRRYEFLFACNGVAALDTLSQNPDVDIVLTDLRMPKMDGLTFLRRAGDIAPIIRTIVISAFSDMSNIRSAMSCGAYDFLVKPMRLKELEETIEKAARDVRERRKTLRVVEENQTLRMFVDDAVIEKLLPLHRISAGFPSESFQATAAFIDISGDHGSADGLDSSEAVERLNRSLDALASIVEEREGIVARFQGDLALALFRGENREEDALLASMDVCSDLSRLVPEMLGSCEPRIGIASGRILTGSVGAPSRHRFEQAFFGDAISEARRLVSRAQPGQILTIESLCQELGPVFHWEAVGEASSLRPSGSSRRVVNVCSTLSFQEEAISLQTGAPTLKSGSYRCISSVSSGRRGERDTPGPCVCPVGQADGECDV